MDIRKYAEALHKAWAGTRSAAMAGVLDDAEATTGALLCVLKAHFGGDEFLSWEPETLWEELPDVHHLNRDKIMAGMALMTTPVFFVDPWIFGHTCSVMGNDPIVPADFPHPPVLAIAWAAIEAQLIMSLEADDEPEYGDEVIGFVAAKLGDEGWVKAPPTLAFAQEELDKLLSDQGKDLAAKMKSESESPASTKEKSLEVQETRLSDLDAYVDHRIDEAIKALLLLL